MDGESGNLDRVRRCGRSMNREVRDRDWNEVDGEN